MDTVGGTGTTHMSLIKPCSYGLIFANTSVSATSYITDIKICLRHSCKVSNIVYARTTSEGFEQYGFRAFTGNLTETSTEG